MKRLLLLSVAGLLAVPQLASAQETTSGIRGGKPYFEATQVSSRYATVLALDLASRELTVKSEAGDTVKVSVKPEVKTLKQVKVGDRIKITETDRFTIHVDPTGSPELIKETMRSDAKEGEQPRVSEVERITYKATISAMDKTKGTVTLKDDQGEEFVVTPEKRENLSLVNVGDNVVFTATKTRTSEVEKAPAKKSSAAKK